MEMLAKGMEEPNRSLSSYFLFMLEVGTKLSDVLPVLLCAEIYISIYADLSVPPLS